jgi:hypothetical protein
MNTPLLSRAESRQERVRHLLHAVEASGRVCWREPLARYEPALWPADAAARADAETVAALATELRRRCP